MYEIVAEWANGEHEVVDETDSLEDAKYLVEEYRMAYQTRVYYKRSRS